jgi:hypothetical protein
MATKTFECSTRLINSLNILDEANRRIKDSKESEQRTQERLKLIQKHLRDSAKKMRGRDIAENGAKHELNPDIKKHQPFD